VRAGGAAGAENAGLAARTSAATAAVERRRRMIGLGLENSRRGRRLAEPTLSRRIWRIKSP
jgi:hypothetical protein